MEVKKLENFTKGWIVGDFEPSIIRTKDFEVAVKRYKKGDREETHFHKIARDITVVINGIFRMNELILKADDIVKLKREENANFECIEDGVTVVIKMPSIIGDKYII